MGMMTDNEKLPGHSKQDMTYDDRNKLGMQSFSSGAEKGSVNASLVNGKHRKAIELTHEDLDLLASF